MTEKEIWKSMTKWGSPDYSISSFGRLKLKNGKISKAKPRKDGYIKTIIWTSDGKRIGISISVIVATLFVPNPSPKTKKIVDHINRKRDDNHHKNLRWVTGKGNNCNQGRNKTHKGCPILQYTLDGKFVKRWDNAGQIADSMDKLKISVLSQISQVCSGVKTSAYGYGWKKEGDIKDEKWVELKKFQGYYVSNFGRLKRPKGSITAGSINDHGYKRVGIGCPPKNYLLHRLIYQGFNPEKDIEDLEIDHIDSNPENNNIENLRPLTKEKHRQITHNIEIIQCSKNMDYIDTFTSAKDAAKAIECNLNSITEVCRAKKGTCKGYRFFFRKDVRIE